MIVMRRTIVEFIVGIPVIIGVYALLEFFYDICIVHIPYTFDILTCACCLIAWFACMAVTYIARKKKGKI